MSFLDPLRNEFKTNCILVTMATAATLIFFNPQKLPHTTLDIPTKSHEIYERNPFFFKSPLSCFHGNCCKVCPADSDIFGLSLSTICGSCPYQVSSISVLHFGRFHGNDTHFEKNQPLKAQLHMAYGIPTRFHKV